MNHLKHTLCRALAVASRLLKSTAGRPLGLVALSLLAWHPRLGAQTPAVVETIYSFPSKTPPSSGVIQDARGNFYGTTNSGDGTVYQLTPTGQFNVLHAFTGNGDDGDVPVGGLLLGLDGNLYGTTRLGGTGGLGTFFQLILTPTVQYKTLHSFTAPDPNNMYVNTDGNEPAGVIQDKDGNFYGVANTDGPHGTAYGGGTVFKATASGGFAVLHSFTPGTADGFEPTGRLTLDGDGNLFGTTVYGGDGENNDEDDGGPGTVFELPAGGGFKTLNNFETVAGEAGSNDYGPAGLLGGLVLGKDGNLYGTTENGGSHTENGSDPTGSVGTVFKLTPQGALTVLHSFSDTGTDGFSPAAPLVLGKDGNFYGTTERGGSSNTGSYPYGYGTVFKITPAGDLTTLYSFTGTGTDGGYPGELIEGNDGNFYGTTGVGGTNSSGAIFVVNVIPTITNGPAATATVGQTFSLQITATNDPTQYDVSGLPKGLSVDAGTGLITGTPEAVGTYSLTLHAANALGEGTAILTLTVKTAPPIITSAKTATANVGSAFSYQITATNSPTRYAAPGLPTGLTVNATTGLISGTPKNAGKAAVTISATNAGGTGSAKVTITITALPVITSATTATAAVGSAFSYQIMATNNPTSYAAPGLPTGLSVNTTTGLITGTPKNVGRAGITISATNATGTGTAKLTITIAEPAPVVTSATSASATQGKAFSYQITATESPTSYAASGLPTGLSVNTTTGLISGTPRNAGKAAVTISATNATGTGTARVTITSASS